MRIAKYIIIFLLITTLIVNIVKHGQPKEDYHAGYGILGVIITGIIYYYAGIFSVLNE